MYLFELDEPIWEMEHDAPCLIAGMVAGPNTIDVPPSCSASNGVSVILRSRGKSEVHKMGNRSLTPAAVGISHGTLLAVSTSHSLGLIALQIPPFRRRFQVSAS